MFYIIFSTKIWSWVSLEALEEVWVKLGLLSALRAKYVPTVTDRCKFCEIENRRDARKCKDGSLYSVLYDCESIQKLCNKL